MIKLTKLALPAALQAKLESWQAQVEAHVNGGTTIPDALKAKYRDSELKAVLIQETHEKCAYCESRVTATYFGDVEHIIPKSVDLKEHLLKWSNLTFVCAVCNNGKRAYYSASHPLINPYVDDPSDVFVCAGPCIFHVLGNFRAEQTVGKLELNRPALLENRSEKIQGMNQLIDRWDAESDPVKKEFFKDAIIAMTSEDKEYSLVLREYCKNRCGF